MAQVSVRINGYSYMLGCADGQEDHLRALAEDIDQRIDGIKLAAGPSGEARLLLMAALVLSDELYELRKQMGQPDGGMPAEPLARPEPKTARRLTRLARRAEAIADSADEAAALAQMEPDGPEAMTPGEKTPAGEISGEMPSAATAPEDGAAREAVDSAPDEIPSSHAAEPEDRGMASSREEDIAARPERP